MDFLNTSRLTFDETGRYQIAAEAPERRKSKRVPLRSRALVGIPGDRVLRGYTIDISREGLSMLVPARLNPGQECRVFFTMMIEDKLIAISGQGKVANCTCSMLDGFRVGMQLDIADKTTKELVEKLFADKLK